MGCQHSTLLLPPFCHDHLSDCPCQFQFDQQYYVDYYNLHNIVDEIDKVIFPNNIPIHVNMHQLFAVQADYAIPELSQPCCGRALLGREFVENFL